MTPEEFRKLGKDVVDWIADYHSGKFEGPVFPFQMKPGDTLKQLPASPPDLAESGEQLLQDFNQIVVPGLAHWNDPRFMAYFPCNNSLPSILAEMLTAGVGVNTFSWVTSPSGTELEIKMIDWLGQMLGLNWKGALQDTASTSTLCALLSAREQAQSHSSLGLSEIPFNERFVCYVSDQAHSSIQKAVRIAGLGEANLRVLSTVGKNQKMCPLLFEEALVNDKAKGLRPFFVNFTVGTTGTTAVDDVPALFAVAKKHGLWTHVDAALAGTAALLPEMKWLMKGVEDCDSFVFNPHKWMFTNFDCSAYFCKDPNLLKKAMSIEPEYLKSAQGTEVENLRDWGITLGRRFRALKLWFVIKSHGVQGLQTLLRKHLGFAQSFASWIEQEHELSLFCTPQLNLVCFSVRVSESLEVNNSATQKLMHSINQSGQAFLSHTVVEGRYLIRASFGQTRSEEADLENVKKVIKEHLELIKTA